MNILMHGAGALGSYFGGRLLEAGLNVSFFVRERRADQLVKEGLKLSSPEGDFEQKDIAVYTSTGNIKDIDLIILAVKGYHLKDAIPQVKTIVNQTGAYVLPLLNGMEHLGILQQEVGEEKVLGGFASIIATLNEKGHVIHSSGSSAIKFGAIHEKQLEICNSLEEVHTRVKANIVRKENILKHMWKKYIFITAFSGMTSATQLSAGYIANNEATYITARKAIYEMSMIAQKEGIDLTVQEVEKMVTSIKRFHIDATSSMHQDMRKGLPIEVEHLQGGALRFAAKYQIQTPVLETLYGILKPYENGIPNL
jgi:2-dehydropantoate 2-reductase